MFPERDGASELGAGGTHHVCRARERLPVAIAEFDVGGLVHKKVSDYPFGKLEELVLSVAQHHLKTIELFGAIIGFFIGVGQAIYFLAHVLTTKGTKDTKGTKQELRVRLPLS